MFIGPKIQVGSDRRLRRIGLGQRTRRVILGWRSSWTKGRVRPTRTKGWVGFEITHPNTKWKNFKFSK